MFYVNLLLTFSLLFFTACGEESNYMSDEDNRTLSSFSGLVVDGYITNATVCLDFNNNSVCEGDEPHTATDSKGNFQFTAEVQDNTFVTLLATGGVDSSTQFQFNEQFKRIIHTEQDGSYSSTLSPLTDLVASSFLSSTTKDLEAFDSAKVKIASLLSLTEEDLEKDPMQNATIFSKSQEIQNIKNFVINVANETLSYGTNSIDYIHLQNRIKELLISENLNIANIFEALELEFDKVFDADKKAFAIEQIKIIRDSLLAIFEEVTLDEIDLDQLQLALATITDESIKNLIPSYTGNPKESEEDPQESEDNPKVETDPNSLFNTIDAIYDENACKASGTYNVLSSSSFSPAESRDPLNEVSVKSSYVYDANVERTKVELFYPDFTEVEATKVLFIIRSNYYFTFDKAWVTNANNRVYVKTAKDDNGLYSCYRFDLNSEDVASIKEQKVFSYY